MLSPCSCNNGARPKLGPEATEQLQPQRHTELHNEQSDRQAHSAANMQTPEHRQPPNMPAVNKRCTQDVAVTCEKVHKPV